MDKSYFNLIQQVKEAGLTVEARREDSGTGTFYNKNLMIFCVNCSQKVSSFPLPTYMQCKCAHGLREKRGYWSEAWIQVVMNKTLSHMYTVVSMNR